MDSGGKEGTEGKGSQKVREYESERDQARECESERDEVRECEVERATRNVIVKARNMSGPTLLTASQPTILAERFVLAASIASRPVPVPVQ